LGLLHDGGVPSFDAFAALIETGCACGSPIPEPSMINSITEHIQFDQTLTPANRSLASDMLTHFARYANTTCRGCALGWGIWYFINAIWGFIVLGAIIGGILTVIGFGLVSYWAYMLAMDIVSESRLRLRERKALEQIKRAS
jgi:hypothetical protein